MTALRPPARWAHLRWHWIDTPSGKEPWMWSESLWTPAGCRLPSEMMEHRGCAYSHPCDPSAVVLGPADDALVERACKAQADFSFGDGYWDRRCKKDNSHPFLVNHRNSMRAAIAAMKGDGG